MPRIRYGSGGTETGKRLRRRGGRMAAVATVAVMALAAPASAQTIVWSNYLPKDDPVLQTVLKPWFAEIARVTEGRVRVAFAQAPWGPAPRQIDIVEQVVRHAAFGGIGYTPHRFPVARIAELPFLSDSAEALSVAYWRTHVRYLAKAGEFAKAIPLALAAWTPGMLWSPAKAFTRIEDFQGARLLVVGATASSVAQRLGATPILMPPPLARETLVAGQADAFLGLAGTVRRRHLLPSLKRVLRVPAGLYADAHFVVIAPTIWARMAPTDRAAIRRISGERLARALGAAWDRETATVLAPDGNVDKTIAEPSLVAAMKARLAELETRWRRAAGAKGIDGAAALAFLRAEIAREEAALRTGDGK